MNDIENVLLRMIEFDAGDPKRIQHFMKVYEFAHLIGTSEQLPPDVQRILDTAAVLHDIGILPCEKKYGHCTGKMQEEEGPAYAEELLRELGGYTDDEIARICFLIGHHHTYDQVDGIDYRILLEADFLVNSCEDSMDRDTIVHAEEFFFRTETGRHLLELQFAL